MVTELRSIKFYLDESVNNVKKDKILTFLKECQTVENKLLEYYWNNFDKVLNADTWITFYTNRYMITEPRTKFHHYMNILHMVYMELKSLQTKIIKRVYFRNEDNELQRIYNYCSKFCFEWDRLEKYVEKQLKQYKIKDDNYYNFLVSVKNTIADKEKYAQLKTDIKTKFYEVKDKYNLPVKKEFQIHCNTAHTIDMDKSNYFQWIFIIDSNTVIGGTEKKGVFDKMVLPVKYSDYHRDILDGKELKNTFNLKLNKYGRIEIIGTYEIEIDKIKSNPTNKVGIDIGLKKLITCSDREVIEQNPIIINKLEKLLKKQTNRQTLEKHLQKKYNDENFLLSDKNYMKKQTKLSTFVKCDNRYRVKQFLAGRENDLIVMEDLDIGCSKTHSRDANYKLKRMGIQGIKNDLIKYTKDFGISVTLINPAFTSQQCPKCGHISKENRKTQEMFCCVSCGHTDNADYNASVNIMNRHGDTRIKLDTPYWRVKEILQVL
jgi:IS605 OrfB family transposase